MKKTLSVSVAAYNLGDMVLTNLKSMCESKVADDIEIIVTDDGSKDNTPDIVEEYAKKYPNTVKLIRKNNEGPGSTVNSGIKNATGKYFRMIDGDDWAQTENLEEYVTLLKNTDADLVISDFVYYDNQAQKCLNTVKATLPVGKVVSFDEVYRNVPQFMHAMTFKTDIFKKNNIVLDNCFYTDVEYMLFPMPFVSTVVYFDKTIYIYRIARAGQSVSVDSMKRNIKQHDLVLNHLLDWYNGLQNLTIGQKNLILMRISEMAKSQLNTLCLFDANKDNKKKVKDYFENIKMKNKMVYKNLKTTKLSRLLRWSGFLGYGLAVSMLKRRAK